MQLSGNAVILAKWNLYFTYISAPASGTILNTSFLSADIEKTSGLCNTSSTYTSIASTEGKSLAVSWYSVVVPSPVNVCAGSMLVEGNAKSFLSNASRLLRSVLVANALSALWNAVTISLKESSAAGSVFCNILSIWSCRPCVTVESPTPNLPW